MTQNAISRSVALTPFMIGRLNRQTTRKITTNFGQRPFQSLTQSVLRSIAEAQAEFDGNPLYLAWVFAMVQAAIASVWGIWIIRNLRSARRKAPLAPRISRLSLLLALGVRIAILIPLALPTTTDYTVAPWLAATCATPYNPDGGSVPGQLYNCNSLSARAKSLWSYRYGAKPLLQCSTDYKQKSLVF